EATKDLLSLTRSEPRRTERRSFAVLRMTAFPESKLIMLTKSLCALAFAASAVAAQGVDLTGAGATFPAPIYNKWFFDYAAKTGVKINYQPLGSGAGVRQLTEQTVDFG